ncbi:MAG: ParB N-terminal domain-containing protein [Anaerolineales bacterium]|nr:ParB N-terminal domain-containing protein [Anaerolineales bacterium]
MEVKRIPLVEILLTIKNPRQDAANDPELAGLAASMGHEDEPTLAQPPIVEALENGQYRTVSGERRIRAAAMAGWQTVECLVRPPLAPLVAHRLRVVENLHRKELHPLDQAVALKLAWHSTNAVAMGLSDQVAGILDKEQVPAQTLTELETLLSQHGFVPNHPLVSWDETLDGLGVELDQERRKKLLQVLGVAPEVQAQLRQMDITEAGLRALAKLDPQDQTRLVEEMTEDPALARKVRRISHAVRAHDYGLDEALAEARGVMPEMTEDGAQETDEASPPSPVPSPINEPLADLVVQLMEAAHTLKTALESLREMAGEIPLSALPDPWGPYTLDALTSLRVALETFQMQE